MPVSHVPPTEMVESGLYKICRHPIYLAFTILFSGYAILTTNLWMLLYALPLSIILILIYLKFYEEPALVDRFGQSYLNYQSRVSMLFPIFTKPFLAIFNFIINLMKPQNKLANTTILFRVKDHIMVTYGFIIAFSGIVLTLWKMMIAQSMGFLDWQFITCLYFIALATMFLARVLWWLGNAKQLIKERYFGIFKVGYVSYGGMIAVGLFFVSMPWLYNIPALLWADLCLPGVALAYAVGRLACVSYCCCYGERCQHHGIKYHDPFSKPLREHPNIKGPRFATQYYNVYSAIGIFFIGLLLLRFEPARGLTSAVILILYSISRAIIELYRDRQPKYKGIFTLGHIGCLVLFLIAWIILLLVDPSIKTSNALSLMKPFDIPLIQVIALIPIYLIATFIMGYHRKEIGKW